MTQKATFSLGCFWGPDDFFSTLKGVTETIVGYSGGTTENPNYEDLGDHTETIEISFDDTVISYEELLKHFWKLHDPTEEHKTQYKSIIFYHDDAQKNSAEKSKKYQENKLGKKIVTEIRPAVHFYKAEEYHQKYLQKNKGVC
ncbi:MAG: peptide-methionine (S)-S-oxide reductase MsrA [Parcubacteria group bacterium]|nr:peptide-methionine (S)-S-oxide reductase MsrA [Parcubacteria group bacterium]